MARDTAQWYRDFASQVATSSSVYREWADAVATDAATIAQLERLPEQHRQPPLVFAVASLLGARQSLEPGEFLDFLRRNEAAVARELVERPMQTNEPGRCAALVVALARIDGPIALLEVGASAGLCLYPDRYSYDYSGRELHPMDGPSVVTLTCAVDDAEQIPPRLPHVAFRGGVDLRPLAVTEEADAAWLDALCWPGQHDRLQRVRGACEIARHEPPVLLAGDADGRFDELLALASQAAGAGATPVIVTAGTLVYLPSAKRARLAERIRESGARWVSLEGATVLAEVERRLTDVGWAREELQRRFVVALDEHPLAFCGPYGETLEAWSLDRGA